MPGITSGATRYFRSRLGFGFSPPAPSVMGLACVVNSRRCGRRHYFFTGPLYVLEALASLMNGLRVLRVPWRYVLFALVAGTVVGYGIECASRKYLQ